MYCGARKERLHASHSIVLGYFGCRKVQRKTNSQRGNEVSDSFLITGKFRVLTQAGLS